MSGRTLVGKHNEHKRCLARKAVECFLITAIRHGVDGKSLALACFVNAMVEWVLIMCTAATVERGAKV